MVIIRERLGVTHDALKTRALAWLNGRVTTKGMPCATEVCVGREYVVDAAALCSLQRSYFQRYLEGSGLRQVGDFARPGRSASYYDIVMDEEIENLFVCIFESKVSRGDYFKTFTDGKNRTESPVGNLNWVVTTRGLVEVKEVPEKWGLLETSGNGLREIKKPKLKKLTKVDIDAIAHSLLWARWKGRTRITEEEIAAQQKMQEEVANLQEAKP